MTVKGGTGSGDVNSRSVVNVEQGLEEAGFTVTTKDWLGRYDTAVADAKAAYGAEMKAAVEKGGGMPILYIFDNPFKEPPIPPVTEEDCRKAETDTALFVLARNSGEGKDRRPVAGEYSLFPEEEEAIRTLRAHFKQVILILNVGSVIDTGFLRRESGADAILLMSQAGNIGGYALADVLTGKVTPSGKLTATWAEHYEDYPGASKFSHMNGDVDDEYYEEGIYVGYRYFDTFNVAPAYPFGFGLSYTTFRTETEKVEADGENVTGKGDQHRKPVYGKRSGAGLLLRPPGETGETLSGANSSRNTIVAAVLVLDGEAVTEKLSNRLTLDCEMKSLSAGEALPYTYEGEQAQKESAPRISIDAGTVPCIEAVYQKENPRLASSREEKLTMDDVRSGRASLDELTVQLTVEEMAELCVGTARGGMGGNSVIGAASAACPGAAGDTTSRMIEDRNVRNMILADGPAGLRLSRYFSADRDGNLIPGSEDSSLAELGMLLGQNRKTEIPQDAVTYYQYCTAIPIATLLAQTWDREAVEEAGDIVGGEMEELGVTLWLAPGMNIHRNPLCGRNFEYYSEDPLVAGCCAAADTLGVQKHRGVGTTIKHFAFNNQEDNRMHVNAHIGERALREIYLKCFEIAVKTSQPMSIMTSYNLINGTHTANSYDLLTAIARDEWGFGGIIMTDWGTTGSIEMNPGRKFKYGCSNAAGCVRAGNDLTMPGSQADVDEIVRSVDAKEGEVSCPITLGDLQACVGRMLNVIAKSSVYENAAAYRVD